MKLTGKQRNWLYMILKALYESNFDGAFTKKDRDMINSLMHDLELHYNSNDEKE